MYVSKNTPMSISCAVHGVFLQSPAQHVNGIGCKECTREAAEGRRDAIRGSVD